MAQATTTTASPAPAKEPPPKAQAKKGPERPEGSEGAKKTAAAILEVLAGARTTTDAAEALSVSLPRYYQLEARAIAAMVEALEPRRRGRQVSPDHEIEALRKEKARLERECARSQALARTAQRALGLGPPRKPVSDPKGKGGGKKKRVRRPLARGVRAAQALRSAAAEAAPGTPASGNGGAA